MRFTGKKSFAPPFFWNLKSTLLGTISSWFPFPKVWYDNSSEGNETTKPNARINAMIARFCVAECLTRYINKYINIVCILDHRYISEWHLDDQQTIANHCQSCHAISHQVFGTANVGSCLQACQQIFHPIFNCGPGSQAWIQSSTTGPSNSFKATFSLTFCLLRGDSRPSFCPSFLVFFPGSVSFFRLQPGEHSVDPRASIHQTQRALLSSCLAAIQQLDLSGHWASWRQK